MTPTNTAKPVAAKPVAPKPVAANSGPLPFGTFDQLAFFAILAFALYLRLPYMTQPLVDVFSWREASTAMIAENYWQHGWNIFLPEVNWSGPGPSYQGREFGLYGYLVAILNAVFGWHDWFGRLVAIGFGLLTVFALHRLVALIWDERHAHAAALAYAVMPGAIAIESSVLPDPAMLGLITLGIWLYARAWAAGSKAYPVWAALAFTLGALSKLPGLGVGLAILWLMVLSLLRGDRTTFLRTLIAVAIGLAAIIGYYAWAIHLGRSTPPYHVAGSGYVWDHGLSAFIAEAFYAQSLWDISIWWFYGYAFLALIALGLWLPPRFAKEEPRAPGLTRLPYVWLLAAIIVYLCAAKEISTNPWNLHLFHVPLAIFAGRALILLAELGGVSFPSLAGVARFIVMGAILAALSQFQILPRLKTPQGEEARLMGQAIDRLAGPDDLVVTISPEVGDPIAVYYSRRNGWTLPPGGGASDWSTFAEDDATPIAQLNDMKSQGARWFGVTRNAEDRLDRPFLEHHAGVIAYLDQTAERVLETPEFILFRLQ
ncbi:Dolichyl-phosphate-mannose-protein mannosyltransferase [Celeribacter neptunius]|uniref:Dolichyl-phosphate-mannose-protein mannosyltransferase n=1 Tax=Celeribacter neptunius TaxID=588602 RepID=A0A1I3NUM0_9RHOB|nr:Dolichyl-phosphate-mannose-protein mannosyltransferase [Celeribacter neptunius]